MTKEEFLKVISRAKSYAKADGENPKNPQKDDAYRCFLLLDYIYDALIVSMEHKEVNIVQDVRRLDEARQEYLRTAIALANLLFQDKKYT